MNIDLDRLWSAGQQLADSAKKTANDLAQKGKQQVDLLNAQSRLSKAQRQLGALVYNLTKSGETNAALVQKYVDAIDRLQEEIRQIKQQTPEQTDSQPAQDHGTFVYSYTAEDEEICPQPAVHTCPQCGKEVQEGALFCDGCGAQL